MEHYQCTTRKQAWQENYVDVLSFLQLKTVGRGIACEENKNPFWKTEILYFGELAIQTEKFSQEPLKRKFCFCSERQKVVFKAH